MIHIFGLDKQSGFPGDSREHSHRPHDANRKVGQAQDGQQEAHPGRRRCAGQILEVLQASKGEYTLFSLVFPASLTGQFSPLLARSPTTGRPHSSSSPQTVNQN